MSESREQRPKDRNRHSMITIGDRDPTEDMTDAMRAAAPPDHNYGLTWSRPSRPSGDERTDRRRRKT